MEAEIRACMEQMADEYILTAELNVLLKQFILEKEREQSIWGLLSLTVHRMLGGESPVAARTAAITELLLLALDIVDDLQDNDNSDKPWMQCSSAYALNAVLACMMMASAEAAKLRTMTNSAQILEQIASHILRSVNGQQKDLNNQIATEQDYVTMVHEKSGSLMRLAFYMGFVGIADLRGETVRQLEEMADCVGTAAQIRNDLRDVTRYDVKNDLLSRKRTLPVLYLLEHADEDFPPFTQFYEGTLSPERFLSLKRECLAFVQESGCVEYTEVVQSLFLQRAGELLEQIPGISPWKEQLRRLTIGG